MNQRFVRIVLNGKAVEDDRVREAVLRARESGHRVDVRVTWEYGDAARFAAEAVDEQVDVVVAAGGDGTTNEVVSGLFRDGGEHATALGIVPLGTANDFAAGCGIPLDDPAAALALALEADPIPIDVGRLNERLFLNSASGGCGAEITAHTSSEMKRVLGGFAYFVTGMFSFLTPKHTRLRGPDFAWEGDAVAITVSNGRQAGGGFRVAPKALLDDGLLDVLIIPDFSAIELFTIVNEMSNLETSVDLSRLIYRQLPWLEIEAPEGFQVNVDGEPLEGRTFRFEVQPRRLKCVLPPAAPLRPSPETAQPETVEQTS